VLTAPRDVCKHRLDRRARVANQPSPSARTAGHDVAI
jgi:hypothetical protein